MKCRPPALFILLLCVIITLQEHPKQVHVSSSAPSFSWLTVRGDTPTTHRQWNESGFAVGQLPSERLKERSLKDTVEARMGSCRTFASSILCLRLVLLTQDPIEKRLCGDEVPGVTDEALLPPPPLLSGHLFHPRTERKPHRRVFMTMRVNSEWGSTPFSQSLGLTPAPPPRSAPKRKTSSSYRDL